MIYTEEDFLAECAARLERKTGFSYDTARIRSIVQDLLTDGVTVDPKKYTDRPNVDATLYHLSSKDSALLGFDSVVELEEYTADEFGDPVEFRPIGYII